MHQSFREIYSQRLDRPWGLEPSNLIAAGGSIPRGYNFTTHIYIVPRARTSLLMARALIKHDDGVVFFYQILPNHRPIYIPVKL
jgi:hypothetical protein